MSPLKADRPGLSNSLNLLPWLISAAMVVLWCTYASPRVPGELAQIGSSSASNVHPLQAVHLSNTSIQHHTSLPDWRGLAACNSSSSREHVKLMEQLLNPQALLQQLVKQKGHTWLQIGSNTMDNMNNNDPLKKLLNSIPTWNKVFVEPIPQLYAKLQHSIKHWPNSTAINVALSPNRTVTETKAKMWCYGAAFDSKRLGKDLPRWANQICSFNSSHIGRHFKGKQGVPVQVTAVSLQELLRRRGISSVQVLVIDTEGFDYAVLKQIAFDQFRPAFIMWEHKHLYAAKNLAVELMRNHCYAVKVHDMENTVAMSLFV